jgi:hypothetical protein
MAIFYSVEIETRPTVFGTKLRDTHRTPTFA